MKKLIFLLLALLGSTTLLAETPAQAQTQPPVPEPVTQQQSDDC